MGLKFENSFTVQAPVEKVWAYLTDPYRVAPALPGAEITQKTDDRTYQGTITVKVGSLSAKYEGTAVFERLDPETRTAEIRAKGEDLAARGGADMKMTGRVVETAPGESEVTIESDVNVTGVLAQLDRGQMQDVSDQMLKRFTAAMRLELEKPPAFVDADAEQADIAEAVKDVTDTSKTLPPTGLEGLPPLPPREGPETLPVMDGPPIGGGGPNPSRTQPLPAQAGPPPAPPAPPIEAVPLGGALAGGAFKRALKTPITWVLIFMLLVLLAALLS